MSEKSTQHLMKRFGRGKKPISDEIIPRRILLKNSFLKTSIFFIFLRKEPLSEKVCFQKLTTENEVCSAGRQKVEKTFHSIFLSTIDE